MSVMPPTKGGSSDLKPNFYAQNAIECYAKGVSVRYGLSKYDASHTEIISSSGSSRLCDWHRVAGKQYFDDPAAGHHCFWIAAYV